MVMTHPDSDVSETEIEAFLVGQLDPERRFAVVDHLARHPLEAGRVMADLRMQEGLRLALSQLDTPPPQPLQKSAAQLSRALGRSRPWSLRMAAAVALIALGWSGQMLWTGLQDLRTLSGLRPLAETALDAREAVELRRTLSITPARVDAARIAGQLGLELPSLPEDWQIRDTQVVATPESPGLAVVIDTPDMGEVMLLTLPQREDGFVSPLRAFDHRGSAVAVFEHGPAAYVLLDASSGQSAVVSREAERMLRLMN
jgi:anti-sigma factor RsiW